VLDGAGNQTPATSKRDVEFVVTKLDFLVCNFSFSEKQFFPSCETPSTSLECGFYENGNVVQQFEVDDRYWRWMVPQVATYCMGVLLHELFQWKLSNVVKKKPNLLG
jgi:hypothetical protein